jgi:hypothetical protein
MMDDDQVMNQYMYEQTINQNLHQLTEGEEEEGEWKEGGGGRRK